MFLTRRRALLWVLLAAVAFSPEAVGALPYFRGALLLPAALFAFSAYAFSYARSRRPMRAALVILSACFAVTLFDLAARPLVYYLYERDWPAARFVQRWPALPLLPRYLPDLNFDGETFGDLAARSWRKDWREPRRIRFVTDAYGFRNEPRADAERPLDVIVLGDSFGAPAGTSQEDLLASVLARDYRLSVYNLSVSSSSPQQEYVSLLLEGTRLKTREGTRVLWLLFEGNDLDDPYYTELENSQARRSGLLERLAVGLQNFRARSPVRRLLSSLGADADVAERKFPDGRPVFFFNPYARHRGRTAEEVRRHPNYEGLLRTFAAMRRLADERRLSVEVALVPTKEAVYSWALDGAPPWSSGAGPSGFSAVLADLCANQGFRFLDLKPALVAASRRAYEESGALLWWRDDTHWNPAGQRVAAAAVCEQLLECADRRL
jgi:hypothetical protein